MVTDGKKNEPKSVFGIDLEGSGEDVFSQLWLYTGMRNCKCGNVHCTYM